MKNFEYPVGATPLDPDELEGIKYKHVETRNELDELEQANIQEGLLWVSRFKTKEILNEEFICKLHKKLFGKVWSWAGNYRKSGKNIGVDAHLIPMELRLLLDDLDYWLENDIFPPLETALRFHHRLVQIHLFPNGNGRHARIMSDILLKKNFRHGPIDWSGGCDLQSMNTRRKEYIEALSKADGGDYEPLLQFANTSIQTSSIIS